MAPEKLRKLEQEEAGALTSATEYKKHSKTEPPGWAEKLYSGMDECFFVFFPEYALLTVFQIFTLCGWKSISFDFLILLLTVPSLLAYNQMVTLGKCIMKYFKQFGVFYKASLVYHTVKKHLRNMPVVGRHPLSTHKQSSSRWRCMHRTRSYLPKCSTKRETRCVCYL